jgi:SAM-dependent methyltransferase
MVSITMDLIEKIRRYWDAQPCNIGHSTEPVGTAEYYREANARRYFVEQHIRDFAAFHLWQGKRVLEIGCGIGADAEEFARHGAEYVGIDLSGHSLAVAQDRFAVFGLPGEFHLRDASVGISDLGEFDLVYSCGVIHHHPDDRAIIKNAHSVLRDRGELRFMVYAAHSWKHAMIRKGLDQYEAQDACPYAKTYTHDDIYDLVDGLFTIGRIRQDHCFMYNVDAYKVGHYQLEPWFEAMPESMRAAVREYLGWHLLVKAIKI